MGVDFNCYRAIFLMRNEIILTRFYIDFSTVGGTAAEQVENDFFTFTSFNDFAVSAGSVIAIFPL